MDDTTQALTISSNELENIATLMVTHTGNLAKVSRDSSIPYNAMALRNLVSKEPAIRRRYQQLLSESLQEAGLHIAERILAIKEMQDNAFGDEEKMIPPDLTSKEDAAELLAAFLQS